MTATEYPKFQLRLPMSPSRLNSWEACPKKVYYEGLGYPTVETDSRAAQMGTLVHDVVGEFFMNISDLPENDEIEGLALDIFDEKWRSSPVRGFEDKATTCVDNFIRKEKERRQLEEKYYKPTHIEYEFESFPFHGTIDWYNANNGIIRDWKTNADPGFSDDMLRQGMVYKNLVRNNGLKVNMVIFEMLINGTSQVMPLKDNKWLKDQLVNMRNDIQKGLFIKKPKMKKNRYFCDNYCGYRVRCDQEDRDKTLGQMLYKSDFYNYRK